MSEDLNYEELDPGIREVVRRLRAQGFVTCDSGDGVSKPPEARVFELPHVVARCEPEALLHEARRLQGALDWVEPDWRVEATYIPKEAVALLLAVRGVLPDVAGPTAVAPAAGNPCGSAIGSDAESDPPEKPTERGEPT
jgi:hypothetical protein